MLGPTPRNVRQRGAGRDLKANEHAFVDFSPVPFLLDSNQWGQKAGWAAAWMQGFQHSVGTLDVLSKVLCSCSRRLWTLPCPFDSYPGWPGLLFPSTSSCLRSSPLPGPMGCRSRMFLCRFEVIHSCLGGSALLFSLPFFPLASPHLASSHPISASYPPFFFPFFPGSSLVSSASPT